MPPAGPPRLPTRAGRFPLALCLLLAGGGGAAGAEDWAFDVLHLKNKRSFEGLLLRETPAEVEFRWVVRRPGRATVTNRAVFRRAEVDRLELLDPAERELLEGRLRAILRERDLDKLLADLLNPRLRGRVSRLEGLEFEAVPWAKDGKAKALQYESAHFRLVTSTGGEVADVLVHHLEQIYAAYTRFLPPRHAAGRTTTIRVAGTPADYQALLRERGHTLLNPALFDPERNEVLCLSELQRIRDHLAESFDAHRRAEEALREQEAALKKLYGGKVPDALLRPLVDGRKELQQADRGNLKEAGDVARRLLRMLYHESFHAYLANFVYPPSEAEVPRWLNEGLAQVFEGALVEAGELRVERPDAGRLDRARELAREGGLVGVADLLRSGPRQFLVVHGSDRQTSDRHYLTAWALAYYLAFERGLVGTAELDGYVGDLARGADPLDAFHRLVGRPPRGWDRHLRDYLLNLRPDGG